MNRPMSLVEQMMEAISIVRQERLGGALPAEPETSSSCSPMTASQPPAAESTLPAVRQWSHPFGDRADPLLQLTQLAKAASGYYPLGRNGIWHPGVHFDSGTAGTQDQSHIRCLADGEVVAYRIDSRTPTTTYRVNRQPVQRSFARGFVLVRHRLQAPRIDGNPVEPPSLTFYSLYMHLQDWAAYQAGPGLQRPSFWPAGNTRKVKDSEKDSAPYLEGLVWLRTRIGPEGGAALSGLARGTTVTVSGSGRYRRLENFPGPRPLLLDDGTLNGHVSFNYLAPLDGDRYRVTAHQLIVRSTASRSGQELMRLPQGTVVTISGEGEYRKLEWVDQYVHFDSLLSEPEPLRPDGIVVLDQPVPIKAGELIGHLGDYQNGFAEQPSPQLHLEVFSGENVETFIRRCRAWAQRLPASGKTWLKLPRGTPVVPHQEHFSPITPPTAITGTPSSDADLLLPKHWLDGLGPDRKIKLSATEGHEACTWYRLDDLLHDAGRQLLKGWVKVEDDSSSWVSPWAWSGYEVIYNGDTVERCMAYALKVEGVLPSEKDRARQELLADLSDRGPLRSRLFDLIDQDRNGVMTAEELQHAIGLPALAQSIAQLVINTESEWYWKPGKWDALDALLGHSNSTPNENWLAEKQRIEQLCWWHEVAPKVGLPAQGRVWHMHPIGLVGSFVQNDKLIHVGEFLRLYAEQHYLFAPGTPALTQKSKENLQKILEEINNYYSLSAEKPNIYEVSYMLATVRHEAYQFRTAEFFSASPEYGAVSYFDRYDPVLAVTPSERENAKRHGNTQEGDGYKYRGRGCVHLTWKENYRRAAEKFSIDFVSNPDLAAEFKYSVPIMIWGMKEGVFTGKGLSSYINSSGVNYAHARKVINGMDKSELIASYAQKFEGILRGASVLSEDF